MCVTVCGCVCVCVCVWLCVCYSTYQAVPVNDVQLVGTTDIPGVASKHYCSVPVDRDKSKVGTRMGYVTVASWRRPFDCNGVSV